METRAESDLPIQARVAAAELRATVHVDMVGYSRLVGQDAEGSVGRLKALRRDLIDPEIARAALGSSTPQAIRYCSRFRTSPAR